MNTLVVLAVLVAAALAMPPVRVHIAGSEMSWEQFKITFAKVYTTDAEHDKRASIYAENVRLIEYHNTLNLTWSLGVNEFADMTHDEFKAGFVGPKMKVPEHRNFVELSDVAPMDAVDWRAKGAVTPVKNQGQCGSCWSFSTTGSVEGAWFLAKGSLVSLSEQQLVDCSSAYGNEGCNGGLMDDAFKYIIANKGLDTEADYPYTARDGRCDAAKQGDKVASISAFADVTANSQASLQAAVTKQPVSVAIEADQSGFQFYKSGVFAGVCGHQLDHGVLAVGYDTTATTPYWIVKNSWGASWGDQGYIYMAQGKGAQGICGINMMASYPTV